MAAPRLAFRHERIDSNPPGAHHDITLLHDLTGDGRPDIVGKPYHPESHIDIWYNQLERAQGEDS
jgi:hypothetical protein